MDQGDPAEAATEAMMMAESGHVEDDDEDEDDGGIRIVH